MILAALLAASEAPALTICADRPSKANATCTVAPGHWQLETSAVDWTRVDAAGSSSEILTVGQTVLKAGIDGKSDLELGFTPYAHLSTDDVGFHERASGVGDLVVRYKRRLTNADGAIQFGVIPFIKVPVAKRPIGNHHVEGGIAAPISFSMGGPLTLTLGPEVDILADGDGHGHHLGLVNLVNVSGTIAPRLTLAAELWNGRYFDPMGTVDQWSLDGAASYLATQRIQLDAGANFGLNRVTPDVELYAGASVLF